MGRSSLRYPFRLLLAVIAVAVAGSTLGAQTTANPTIALVLSGGGARGAAHIGVLKRMEELGIQPDIIVGSSFGAIVGGLWAAGYTATELDSLFRSIDWAEVSAFQDDTKRETLFFAQKAEDDRNIITLRFRNFEFVPPQALAGSARFASVIQQLLWSSPLNSVRSFDSLACRFRAVATDLATGKWVALSSGNLATALQASASFPLRYAPVRVGDAILVDGGLSANIPIDPALELHPDITIVVNTTSPLLDPSEITDPLSIADQSLSIAMKQLDSAALQKATVVITPELGSIRTFDITRLGEAITAGYEAAANLPVPQKSRPSLTRATTYRCEIAGKPLAHLVTASSQAVATYLQSMDGMVDDRRLRTIVQRELRAEGFAFAFVRAITMDNDTLVVTIDGGAVADIASERVRPVDLAGVRRDLTFANGHGLTVAALTRSADNLRASELVTDVDLRVEPHADSGVTVLIGATNLGNQIVRIGGRVDNERYGQGSLDLLQINAVFSGLRIGMTGQLGARSGLFNVEFEIPRIAGSLWTAQLRAYTSFRNVWIYQNVQTSSRTLMERDRIAEFSEDRIGARVSAGRQLERNGVILGEFRYEQQRYRDLETFPRPGFQPLATLIGVIRWDDRNRIDFATSGRVIDLFLESSVLSLSNGVSFTKASALASWIVPVGNVFVTPTFRIGAADLTLPGAELFSLGGQDLFFGMREDEERGRQIVVGNLEAMIKLPFSIIFDTYISARYDVGAVWAVPEKIRIADLQHGVGATIGFDTPVGPARFSVGRRFRFLDAPPAVAWGPYLGYFAIGVRL